MREVLRGEELPAQWQKYPLKTQQELMRGRDSLADHALERWVDEGVVWLRDQFKEKNISFSTQVDIEKREVLLTVQKRVQAQAPFRSFRYEDVFSVVEKIESFVSHLTVTKIILIAG